MAITRRRTTALLGSLTALTLAFAACSPSDSEDGNVQGTSSSPVDAANAELPTVEAAPPELPVTFRGDDGRDIVVESLDSVFVLDDATMEIMAALGLEEHIGIAPEATAVEEYASNADHRVTATGSGQMTVEGVVAMEPTLMIGTNMRRQAEIVEKLQDAEVPATLINLSQSPPEKIRKTAALLGVPDAGEKLAAQVTDQFDEAEKFAAGVDDADRPRVMALSSSGAGDSGNTTAAGAETATDVIIRQAGAINTGAETGLVRNQAVTAEGIIAAAPEIIIVKESEIEQLGGVDGIWEEVAGLTGTPAEEERRLIIMKDMQLTGGGVSAGVGVLNLQAALFKQ